VIAIIAGVCLLCLLTALSYKDVTTGLLPNIITYPGILLGLAFSFWMGKGVDSLIGVVAGYGSFWIIAKVFLLLSGKEGMGHGDFKLMAMLGAFMGWQAIPFIAFLASALGTMGALISLSLSKKDFQAEVAFGPYLSIAGIFWFAFGTQLLRSI